MVGRHPSYHQTFPLLVNNKFNIFILRFQFQLNHGHLRQHKHDDVIEDVCDGQYFKTHPLFSKDSTALQIMLYYDELEIANALGSKTGKHKLGNSLMTS